jgi:CheY-like chemotaxis protein
VQLPEGKSHVGTGLGLSIVQQFVKLMGGEIAVKSAPGKGSLFRVELPLESVDETEIVRLGGEIRGQVTGVAPGQPTYRILIAEDQRDNQLLLTKLMTDIGLEVRVADDGEECVELFKKWKPDLIWMDRRMPVMDGVEATRSIRHSRGGKKVKIVAVTASAFREQEEELLSAGMDDYVSKPYRFNEIYDCLRRQLGLKLLYTEEQRIKDGTGATLTPQMLLGIGEELQTALRQALETLDSERIEEVVSQIAEEDRALARLIKGLADNYDYPTILQVLDESMSSGDDGS